MTFDLKKTIYLLAIFAISISSVKATEECFEKTSRAIFKFNMAFDDAVLEPIAKGYNNKIINISGKTSLRQSLSVISNASFVVGGDTGMIHAAEALSKHVVAIFGPTNKLTGGGLFSNLSKEIHSSDIWCKPCSINGSFPCYRKKQYCMTEIDDGVILRSIENIYR